MMSARASSISMTGYHSWKISGKNCTFSTDGAVVNYDSGGISGTLRLCLWVTAGEFPSYGYRVASYSLGQLQGGYQFTGYSVKTGVQMPKATGFYNFTISVEEYTYDGWMTVDYISTGMLYLKNGVISKPRVWKIPGGKIKPPVQDLAVGQQVFITLKGSNSHGYVVYVPVGSQLKLKMTIMPQGETMVYGGSKPQGAPALYSYDTSTDMHNNLEVGVGRLYLDYGYFYGVESYSDMNLFFKAKKSGFYKSYDTDQGFSGDSWGVFRIK